MESVEEWLYFALEAIIAAALLAVVMAVGGNLIEAIVSIYRSAEKDVAYMTAFLKHYANFI
ncbi:MAG: hypothetical protein ABWJ97_05295 [Thermoproteus sp.]